MNALSLTESRWEGVSVALVIPCLNEEHTIGDVIDEAKVTGCFSSIYVGDNGSSDRSVEIAEARGATVIRISRPGKGNVVRRLFADVEADVYVMVDGDATYSLAGVEAMVADIVQGRADMSIGTRVEGQEDDAFRRGHKIGNWAFTEIFRRFFRLDITDTLSGYRVMSRRFVKSFTSAAEGFDIETDLNVHAAVLRCEISERPCSYASRPEGSVSKLRTYSDGWRILRRNLLLFRDARPQMSFALLAVPWLIAAAFLVGVPVLEFLRESQVLRFPSLIAGVGAFIVGVLLLHAGLVMSRTWSSRRETTMLSYLSIPRVETHRDE